jgi:hypothetical protein
MSKNHRGLKLNVVSPCREDWNGMIGGDDIRFCGRCRKNVYNLSEMSETQVRELVQGAACVRFYARADGTVVTSKCPPMLRAARRRVLAMLAAFVPVLLGFWGNVAWLRGLIDGPAAPADKSHPLMGEPLPLPPPPVMGGIAPAPHHLMGKVRVK